MKNLRFWQVSEITISYHNRIKLENSPQIKDSLDAANVFRANWSGDIELLEEFNVLFLNRANRIKGFFKVSRGGISGTVVDAKIIFATALKALASSIILAHNHPSGNAKPSQADIDLTKKLQKAGEFLDILVLDHLILTKETYFSFADEGHI